MFQGQCYSKASGSCLEIVGKVGDYAVCRGGVNGHASEVRDSEAGDLGSSLACGS